MTTITPTRRKMLAAVHLAKKAAGLDDDTYRDMLAAHTGRRSAKDCTDGELGRVLNHLNGGPARNTARPAAAPNRAPNAAVVAKIKALWWSLGELGAVRNPSDEALAAFVKGRAGVDALQWISGRDAYKVIEALKSVGERAGVQWGAHVSPQLAVIHAQVAKLKPMMGQYPEIYAAISPGGQGLGDDAYSGLTARQSNELVKRLGTLIRAHADMGASRHDDA